MSLGYNVTLRNAQADAVTTFAGNGALLRIYDGARPTTGAAITTQVLLAELTCGSPFAAPAAVAVLTLNAITQDTAANAAGTAAWFRIVKADGTTHVMDGSVGATGSGADLELSATTIALGQPVEVTSFAITRGNG